MIANAKETINLLDQLRESDRKLTEALLEIARPAKLEGWPSPWDDYRDEEADIEEIPKENET